MDILWNKYEINTININIILITQIKYMTIREKLIWYSTL